MAADDAVTGPINLGNPVETPVKDLAQLVIDLTGSRSRVIYRPLPVDDPIQRCPDIAVARNVLGWEPKVALEPGLERTIAYFDGLLRDANEIAAGAAVPA
jgi:UDP-glucuronate decarboxylase